MTPPCKREKLKENRRFSLGTCCETQCLVSPMTPCPQPHNLPCEIANKFPNNYRLHLHLHLHGIYMSFSSSFYFLLSFIYTFYSYLFSLTLIPITIFFINNKNNYPTSNTSQITHSCSPSNASHPHSFPNSHSTLLYQGKPRFPLDPSFSTFSI